MNYGEGKVVCVTGASGFIGSWLVKQLLQRGYTVKAAVLDTHDPKMTEHLRAFDGAKERLHFFMANLLEEGSFDPAVDGCDGVFHTASPVAFSANDPEAEIVDTAVKGTVNVLQSCVKVHSIKRIVVTSSLAAIINSGTPPLTRDAVLDETWASNPDLCRESKDWYSLSKILAEEAAWKFAKQHGIDLVTINPGFVIGPILQPNLNLSVELFLNLINGKPIFCPYRFVDVRDIAYAHIQALEVSSANGRYVVDGRVTIKLSEILKILHQHFPTLHLPDKYEDANDDPKYQVSDERAKSLGIITCIPFEVSLKDTVESLMEKGFLNF